MGQKIDKTSWTTQLCTNGAESDIVDSKSFNIRYIVLLRNSCPSLSMKEVIELDSVIDVEMVIGKLY